MDRSTFTSLHGEELVMKQWLNADAKADIAFTHGFFEHCGRYSEEAKFFNAKGYNFIAYDQRSHGESEGKYRSYVAKFSNYLDDYNAFQKEINLGQERPYFLFAHSMGGLVQYSFLESFAPREGFCGAIFSAPLLMPDKDTAPLLQKLSGIIAAIMPRLKVVSIDATAVSRNPNEVEKYINDPLNYTDKMYAASGASLIKQMNKMRTTFSRFDHPFLILHGDDDKLAEIEGSKMLYEQSPSSDKTLKVMEDNKHEITKDLDKEIVLTTIVDWMNKRLKI